MYEGAGRLRVYTITGIDITSGGPVPPIPLFTTETNGLRWYTTQVIVRATSISGVSVYPTVSVGSGASVGATDICANKSLAGLTTVQNYAELPPVDNATGVAQTTGIKLGVNVQATATAYTVTVYVIGFYA